MLEFNYDVDITSATLGEDKDLIIEGTALDTSTNENGWAVPVTELNSLTDQFNSKRQVRVDHSKHYKDIVGWVDGAERSGDKIKFRARIYDPDVQRIITKNPTAHHVSIGAIAKSITCSDCGKRSKPFKTCKCKDSHDIVAGIKLRELSFITDPAYEFTEFQPLGFSAALTAGINNFLPKKEYACNPQTDEEKRICSLIEEYNPGTYWNLTAAKELYPEYTSEFISSIRGHDAPKGAEAEIKSEKQMEEKTNKVSDQLTEAIRAELKAAVKDVTGIGYPVPNSAPTNIPFKKTVPDKNMFEQKMEDSGETKTVVAPGGKNIPFKNKVPPESGHEKKMEDEEAKKEDDDEVRRLKEEVAGLKKKLEDEANQKLSKTHGFIHNKEDEDDEAKKEDEANQKISPTHGFIHNKEDEDDEAKKEDEDESVKKKDGPTRKIKPGSEEGGGDAVMVISNKMEELKKKLEKAEEAFKRFHEDDESKKKEDAFTSLANKLEEMGKKMEELTKREEMFHSKKSDEAKKEDEEEGKKEDEDEAKKEDEDEAKKEASSKKKQIGAKVNPDQKTTVVITAKNILDEAWAELRGNIKTKKPEWELPQ